MARVSTVAVAALIKHIAGEQGLPYRINQMSLTAATPFPSIAGSDILERHVAADLAEKTSGVRYPSVHVYCDKVVNELREKFRTFSGTADLVVDIRVSHEHMDNLQPMLQGFVDAVTDILDNKRGQWATGVFYTGGYKVQFGPIKRGGRNFLQGAKVELTVIGSME